MANENKSNDVVPQSDIPQQSLAHLDAVALGQRGASRRRFARAGAGATGVLLTLASQPGMACDICMSPSGYQSYSKTMKAKSHTVVTCTGRGPTYWRNTTSWPVGCGTGVMFHQVFTCDTPQLGRTYGQASCMKILTQQSYDGNLVGMYLMAMYLNAAKGWSSFMHPKDVVAIWDEFRLSGTYSPTGGVTWDARQLVSYLSGTMD